MRLQHELQQAQASSKLSGLSHPAAHVLASMAASPSVQPGYSGAAAAAAAGEGAAATPLSLLLPDVCLTLQLAEHLPLFDRTHAPPPLPLQLPLAGAGGIEDAALSPEQIQAAMDRMGAGAALAATGGLAAGGTPAAAPADVALVQQQIAAAIAAAPLAVAPEQLQQMAGGASGTALPQQADGLGLQAEQQAQAAAAADPALAAAVAAGHLLPGQPLPGFPLPVVASPPPSEAEAQAAPLVEQIEVPAPLGMEEPGPLGLKYPAPPEDEEAADQ